MDDASTWLPGSDIDPIASREAAAAGTAGAPNENGQPTVSSVGRSAILDPDEVRSFFILAVYRGLAAMLTSTALVAVAVAMVLRPGQHVVTEAEPERAAPSNVVTQRGVTGGFLCGFVVTTIILFLTWRQPRGFHTQRRRRRLQASSADYGQLPDNATCRICQEGSEDAAGVGPAPGRGELARFCECRGTLAFVHRDCLETWRVRQKDDRCELCGVHYFVEESEEEEEDEEDDDAEEDRFYSIGGNEPREDRSVRSGELHRFISGRGVYVLTILIVCLLLGSTGYCAKQVSGFWYEALTRCTLESSPFGWARRVGGTCAIGASIGTMWLVWGFSTRARRGRGQIGETSDENAIGSRSGSPFSESPSPGRSVRHRFIA